MTDHPPVQVHVDLDGAPVLVGTAHFHHRGGTTSTNFEYASTWLGDDRSFAIDPELGLYSGSQYSEGLFGALADCAPDRWGRNLISRRHRAEHSGASPAPTLSDADYLLDVSDLTRQGALRFRYDGDSEFVAADHEVPKLVELPKLMSFAAEVAKDDDDSYKAVKALLDAGTGSLGGARPKATVRGDDDELSIAKFPHHSDDWNVCLWEKTALDIAAEASVPTPATQLVNVGPGHALVLARFDRHGTTRVPYMSAMTLVSGRDGDDHDYEAIVDQFEESGTDVASQLEDLFRRVTLSVAVHNTDDHLRNTGFLRAADGWRLSPVFDVNPNPDVGGARQTTISGAERLDDEADGLMVFAGRCRLKTDGARRVIGEVLDATARWRDVAAGHGAPQPELNRFAESFEAPRKRLSALLTVPIAAGGEPAVTSTDGRRRRPPGSPEGGQFA